MSVESAAAAPQPGLIQRAKAILLTPRAEWTKIDGEPADLGKLYIGYLVPLAALAAAAGAIGAAVFGYGAMGITIRLPLTTVIGMGVTQFVMSLIGPFVFGYIVNALAPTFGSTANIGQAHKLTIYSATAGMLAGVFAIFPPIAVLGILGLYSLALLYIGLPILMKTPQDKRLGYFITAIIAAIALALVAGFAMSAVRGAMGGAMFGGGGPMGGPAKVEGKVTLPGGGQVDLSEVDKMTKQLEAAQKGEATVAAVDPASLQALLPEALPGGFARTSISSASTGAVGAAQAEGEYARGEASITLQVMHLGAMGAMASMAGAMGVTANRQDADGYARTRTVNGRVVTEEASTSGGTAKYSVVGKNGAVITADGRGGASADDVKKAVEAIGIDRIEKLTPQ
ncbi:MAG: Yip1 family protein [Hyphomonadaceae bacterium]